MSNYLQLSFEQAQEKDQVVPGQVPALLPATCLGRTAGAAAPIPAPAG